MLTFKQYLTEQQSNTFAFAFGRYSPPTKGHIAHFLAVKRYAEDHHCPYTVFVSKTVDNKKNPVPVQDKIWYIKRAIPDLLIQPATNMFSIVEEIGSSKRYQKLVYLAGGDYFSDPNERAMFDRLEKFAAGKGIELSVENTGERTPGISGTELRRAVMRGDFQTFVQVSPMGIGNITEQDVLRMYEITRRGLTNPSKG